MADNSNNEKERTTAAKMKAGQSGIVVEYKGGHGLSRRLDALGLRPGKKVTKVGSMFGRGPVTLQIGRTQIALGHSAADKVTIELE